MTWVLLITFTSLVLPPNPDGTRPQTMISVPGFSSLEACEIRAVQERKRDGTIAVCQEE